MHRSLRSWTLLLASIVVVAGACNDSERVDLVFSAPPGTEFGYTIDVSSRVTTRLAGPPEVTRQRVRLDAKERVAGVDGNGDVYLDITMRRESDQPRVFAVRLDPGRGVASVDAIEGLPIEALGELGPSRLVLLAHGLPPARSLRPGGTWSIERELELPEGPVVLQGRGRLSAVRHDDGDDVALVEADIRLPVDRVMDLEGGRVRLSGTERTRAELDYLIADGTVRGARSVTTGVFELVVEPPPGSGAPSINGELEVRVESRTDLVDPA